MTRLANLLLTAALVAATSACRSENTAAAAPAPRPPSVAYVSVAPEQVEITGEWIATLDGTVNAQIRPQVSGYLVRRAYNEGAFVHKGDVLLEIDRRPFETALNQVRRAKLSCRPSLTSTERSAEVGNRRVLPEIDSNTDYGGHGGHRASMVESFQPSWLSAVSSATKEHAHGKR
jgi:multidrug efflux pump subunit AcrA (membrane-fusion protein)